MSRSITKPTKWRVPSEDLDLHCLHVDALDPWLSTHWAHSEDTGHMSGLIWVFAGHTGQYIGFVLLQLKFNFYFMVTFSQFKKP